MSVKVTVGQYEDLLTRAVSIANGAPYYSSVEGSYARLSIHGEEAVLVWPEAESWYDSASLAARSCKFEARLLRLSWAELDAWRSIEKERYEMEEASRRSEERQRQIAEEKATLERLKAKYE